MAGGLLGGLLLTATIHAAFFSSQTTSGTINAAEAQMAVGGIAELPDVTGNFAEQFDAPTELPSVAGERLDMDSSSGGTGSMLWVAAVVAAGTIALGSAAWYARRRW